MTARESRPNTDMNVVISGVLKYGVVISTVLVFSGVLILFLDTPQSFPDSLQQLVATGYGRPTLDASQLLGGLANANPISIIQLGLVLLLATPIVRVGASVILFAVEKDRVYVGITLFVLAVLLFGLFFIGPLEAAG